MVDLEYIISGMFTSFIPMTPAGEDAWRVIMSGDSTQILTIHLNNVLAQLRKAGYSVAKAKKAAPVTANEIDNLLAELSA